MFVAAASLDAFLTRLPVSAHVLFVSHCPSADAPRQARWMRDQLVNRAEELELPEQYLQRLWDRLHFAKESVQDIGGRLAPLLQEWTTPRARLITHAEELHAPRTHTCREAELNVTRLDAWYGWLPWPVTRAGRRLMWAGDACPLQLQSLKGAVALVELHGRDLCGGGFGHVLQSLQNAGAVAAIFAAPPGRELFELNCTVGQDCSLEIHIPATMVAHDVGKRLRHALLAGCTVAVDLVSEPGPGLLAGLDHAGRLFEVGWLKFPSLLHVVWAAQWQFVYLQQLQQRLAAETALEVAVFEATNMTGEHVVRVDAVVPALHQGGAVLDGLELDVALSCPGATDESCPVWDHAMQLFACCDDPQGLAPPCQACPTTVWAASRSDTWKEARPGAGQAREGKQVLCGSEIGRWMTPFRRRIGRWVTDASHLLPLVAHEAHQRRCTFTMQITPWAGVWRPSLRLRLTSKAKPQLLALPHPLPFPASTRAASVVPLPFNGGTFDAGFNSRVSPFSFATPVGLQRALVVALISGHGSDEHGCAEFCPTSHHITVNGREHELTFTAAGTLWGCADRVAHGVVPNEHGTWTYGRGGWCNGHGVDPWVADITLDLLPPSPLPDNILQYRGLYSGQDPSPQSQPGFIMMSAHLVLYVHEPDGASSSEA